MTSGEEDLQGTGHPMTCREGTEGRYRYKTSALEGRRVVNVTVTLPTGERSGAHCTGGLVGLVQKTSPRRNSFPRLSSMSIPAASINTDYTILAARGSYSTV